MGINDSSPLTYNLFVVENDNHSILPNYLEEEYCISGESTQVTPIFNSTHLTNGKGRLSTHTITSTDVPTCFASSDGFECYKGVVFFRTEEDITPLSPQDSPAIGNTSTTNYNNSSPTFFLLNNETNVRRIDDSFPLTNTLFFGEDVNY